MAKYGKKMVDAIVRLMKSDTFTITEICAKVGITTRVYYLWLQEHEEFAEAIKQAENDRMQNMVMIAKKSLMQKLQGYDVIETRTVTIPSKKRDKNGALIEKPKIKEQTSVKKHIAADTTAIIFTLTNGDPEHWRNRQSTEVTGKDGKDLFAQKTDDELTKEIEELKRKLE